MTGDGELQDFQFFNTTRLQELFDKEQNYEVFKHNQSQKEQAARAQVSHALLTCSSRALPTEFPPMAISAAAVTPCISLPSVMN